MMQQIQIIVEATRPTARKPARQTTVRNLNWSQDEDETLYKAWLSISKDASGGTNQQKSTLWARIINEYTGIINRDTTRNANALMNRWSTLKGHLTKFSGYVQMVERQRLNGFNSADTVKSKMLFQ